MNYPNSLEPEILHEENQQHAVFNSDSDSIITTEFPSSNGNDIEDQISCSSGTASTSSTISSSSSTASSTPSTSNSFIDEQSTEVPILTTGDIDTSYPFHSLVEKNKSEQIQFHLQLLPSPYHSSFSTNYNHIQQSIYPHVHNLLQQHHPNFHVNFTTAKQKLLNVIHQQRVLNPHKYLPCENFLIGEYCDQSTCNHSHHELYSQCFNQYCEAYITYYSQFRTLTILNSIIGLPIDGYNQYQSDFQYYRTLLTPPLRELYNQSQPQESIAQPMVDEFAHHQPVQEEQELNHQQLIQQEPSVQVQDIDQQPIQSAKPLVPPPPSNDLNLPQDKPGNLSKHEIKLAKQRNQELVSSLLESIVSQSRSIASFSEYFPLPPLDHPAILSLPKDHDIDQQVQQTKNVNDHSQIAIQLQSYFTNILPSKVRVITCGDFLLKNCNNKDCSSAHYKVHQSQFHEVVIACLTFESVRRSTKIMLSIIRTNQMAQFLDDFTKYSTLSSSSLPNSKFVQLAMKQPPTIATPPQQQQSAILPSSSQSSPLLPSAAISSDNQTTGTQTKAEKVQAKLAAKKLAKKEAKKLEQAEAKKLLAKLKNNTQPESNVIEDSKVTPEATKITSLDKSKSKTNQPKVNAQLDNTASTTARENDKVTKSVQRNHAKVPVINNGSSTTTTTTTRPTPSPPPPPPPPTTTTTTTTTASTAKMTRTITPVRPNTQQGGLYSRPITSYRKAKDFIEWASTSLPQITSELPPYDYPPNLPKPNPINSQLISKWLAVLIESRASDIEQLTKLLLKAKDNNKPVCKGYLIGKCVNSDEFECCYNHDLDCYDIFSHFTATEHKYQLHQRAFHIMCRINQSSRQIRTQYQQDLKKYSSLINVPIVFGCPPINVKYKSSLERFQCTGELVNCFQSLEDYAEYYTAALTEEMTADRLGTEKEVIGIDIVWEARSSNSGPKIVATVDFNSEQRGKLNLGLRQTVAFLHPDLSFTIPPNPIASDAPTFASNQSQESLITGAVKSISYENDSIEFVLSGPSATKFAPKIQSLPVEGWSIAVIFNDLSFKQQLGILKDLSFDSEQLVGLFLGIQHNSIINTESDSSLPTITSSLSSSTTTTTSTSLTTTTKDWRSNSTLFSPEFLPPQITNAPSLRPLNDSQRRAIELALSNPVLSVQGPPGTGKSTTLSNLVYHLIQTRKLQQRGSLQQYYHEQAATTEDIEMDDLLTMMMKRADLDAISTKSQVKTNIRNETDDLSIHPPQKLCPILVAAPSNFAVDDLAELLMRIPDIDVLRISSKRHRAVFAKEDDHVENAALHRRVEAWLIENPDSDLAQLHTNLFRSLGVKERAVLGAKLDDIMNTDLPQHRKQNKGDNDSSSEMTIFLAELDLHGLKPKLSEKEKQQNARDFQLWQRLYYELQSSIISNADVVCTTFTYSVNPQLFPPGLKLEHVILDEVSQGSEVSLLLPLSHFPKHLVLFGDQQQLGPVVKQKGIYRSILLRSMFDRLVETKSCQTTMLSTQYRMHPTIATFSSNQFYNGQVTSGVTAGERSKFNSLFPWPQPNHPICFISTSGSSKERFEGFSSYNLYDIDIMVKLLIRFIQQGVDLTDIGLVLPYAAQCRYLKKELFDKQKAFVRVVYDQYFQTKQPKSTSYYQSSSQPYTHGATFKHNYQRNQYEFDQPALEDAIDLIKETLQIDTVDAFQGREKPLMIFNSVRTAKQNGGKSGSFMTDNRLNVAITRAQYGFIVVGDDNFFDDDDDHGTLSQFKAFYKYHDRLILPSQHEKLFSDFDQLVQYQINKKRQSMFEQRQKRIQEAQARKQKSIENRPIVLSSNATPFFPSLPPPE